MPKKFLICCSFAPSLITFRGDLLASIRARGIDIVAVAPEFDDKTRQWCEARGIQCEPVYMNPQGLNPVKDLRTLVGIWRLIRKHRPDVTLGYTHKPTLYTAYAAFAAGVKHRAMMVTGLGYAFSPDGSRIARLITAITKGMFWVATRMSHVTIFHNSDNEALFVDGGLCKRGANTVVVGGSGVNITNFPKVPVRDVPSDEFVFLLVARLVKYKGITEYARAAQALRAEYPKARFVLVGVHDQSPIGYQGADFDFVKEHLEFKGPSDQIAKEMAECDVFVLPSYSEGLPRTVLEAMATGRAVITTDTEGCRSTVNVGENGILVAPRDWQSLCDGMREFLRGDHDVAKMGDAGRAFVESTFDVRVVNEQMRRALGVDQDLTASGEGEQ
ncbi:glycosyl transferase [Amylibacter marinus]|uniref:Glycosyl transferase n=1 Tax=Amylibacter marinus TaxID=1475483 RepID=A0ABQ5VXZ8_9RHOB|nr:glycosyltransferase family 4 protein [Amylibacter marinus]GLQ35968.1 glycosyl transferase [Amylibacter marinus]